MRWCTSLTLLALVLLMPAPDCSAQWFGTKKPKTPPQQRVPELIVTLKYDKDAHKRADAAEELRQYDTKEFPEIIPLLIEALQGDSAPSVRIEAATSLGRLRPFSVPAAQALEKAGSSDSNFRVKLQAKTSLMYYQLSGYHAPKKTEPQGPVVKSRTDEPPLAGPPDQWWKNGSAPPVTATPASSSEYRPLPTGPALDSPGPVASVPGSQTQPATLQAPVVQGPALQGPAIQGPVLQPPAVQTQTPSQPVWTPVPSSVPPLMPPKS
jgi:hypothetical protein